MVDRGSYGYVPPGWPDAVVPPGSQDWEASAAAFPVKFICSVGPVGILIPCHSRLCLFPPVTART
jgi:hypothetical protein